MQFSKFQVATTTLWKLVYFYFCDSVPISFFFLLYFWGIFLYFFFFIALLLLLLLLVFLHWCSHCTHLSAQLNIYPVQSRHLSSDFSMAFFRTRFSPPSSRKCASTVIYINRQQANTAHLQQPNTNNCIDHRLVTIPKKKDIRSTNCNMCTI